jgi:hypothetical protein
VDSQHAVPIQFWRQRPGPLVEWCLKEAPAWQAEIRQKIRDIEEIASWVKELKQRRNSSPPS